MIANKNFYSVDVSDIPVDVEYHQCNFARRSSIDVNGEQKGVRLFPGDDTPRVFVQCNLINCEPPPGSTITKGNTSIIERVLDRIDELIVDGVTISTTEYYNRVIHGRFDPDTETYVYKDTPIIIPEENV